MKIVNKKVKKKEMLEIESGSVVKDECYFYIVTSHVCDCGADADHVLLINLENGESMCVLNEDMYEVVETELVIK